MRELTKLRFLYALIGLAIGLVIGWAVTAWSSGTPSAASSSTIELGFIAPLTGDVANYGESSLGGAVIAVEEINAAGGINGRQLKLIVEDGQCKPQPSTTAASKLIDINKVSIITGTVCSSETLAAAPIAESSKVVLVSVASSSPDITASGDYIFRVWPSDTGQGVTMADYLFKDKSVKNVAIIHPNSDYNLALAQAFTSSFEERGGRVVARETYEQDAKDFRTQVTKAKAASPDAVYIVPYGEGGLLVKQIRELGFAGPITASETFGTPEILADAGTAAEGIIYATPKFDGAQSKAKAVLEKFRTKYNKESSFGVITASAYDAIYVIADALKQGESADQVKQYLYTVKNYPGAAGTLTIDENGDAIKDFQLMIVKEGKFEKYEK